MLRVVLLVLFFSSYSFSQDCIQTLHGVVRKSSGKYLKIAAGRVIYYEYEKPTPNKPTLIFLPGINRAIPSDYQTIRNLKKQGYGILILATSSHWQSLEGLAGELPYFTNNQFVTLKSIVEEVSALVSYLKIKNPVSVSLSFSSTLAASLPYPVVHSGPLIKPSEMEPGYYAFAEKWEKIWGKENSEISQLIIRQSRDFNYASFWTREVSTNLVASPLFYNRVWPYYIVQGYVILSRAAEKFDFSQADFSNRLSRRFIFAENETRVRLKNQLHTFLKALKKGAAEMIIVRRAEHNVMDSQPQAYETALLKLLDSKALKTRVGVVDPKLQGKNVRWLTGQEIKNLFNFILSFDDSTENSDLSSVLGK